MRVLVVQVGLTCCYELQIMQRIVACAWRGIEYNAICENHIDAFIASST